MITMYLNDLIENGYNLNLQDYPIFNENYRSVLNDKIINRYRFNEIAFETPQRFIFELNTKLSIIMPYYNDLYNAYSELKSIGFNELLHKSIGSETIRELGVGEQNRNNATTNMTVTDDNGLQETTTTNYGKKVNQDYGSKVRTEFGKIVTNDYGRTSTTEQEKDGKSLTLNSDTPQSKKNADLQNTTQWSETPFVTDGNLNITNSGKTKTEDGGEDKTIDSGNETQHHEGGDVTSESGGDIVSHNSNMHDNNVTSGNVDTQYTGNRAENEHITTYNFDYMKTYQQILEILTNIDTSILNELRELFLMVY